MPFGVTHSCCSEHVPCEVGACAVEPEAWTERFSSRQQLHTLHSSVSWSQRCSTQCYQCMHELHYNKCCKKNLLKFNVGNRQQLDWLLQYGWIQYILMWYCITFSTILFYYMKDLVSKQMFVLGCGKLICLIGPMLWWLVSDLDWCRYTLHCKPHWFLCKVSPAPRHRWHCSWFCVCLLVPGNSE